MSQNQDTILPPLLREGYTAFYLSDWPERRIILVVVTPPWTARIIHFRLTAPQPRLHKIVQPALEVVARTVAFISEMRRRSG